MKPVWKKRDRPNRDGVLLKHFILQTKNTTHKSFFMLLLWYINYDILVEANKASMEKKVTYFLAASP
jgi:hypothetical protein